jgi:DNA segregation ATPase FtsK/SpoIIIE-like protein
MPHLLIAGTTGSGKSVCVNAIISCLLLQNTPDELKFVMVDPKRVELTYYNGIPHLMAPVVVELERVVSALQWVSREMDRRYHLFAQVGVRNIGDYNRRVKQSGGRSMHYIVVVIDELADLMMLAPHETEMVITRLAQLARATGIHLVIATQRPSVDVVTGLIKANFPARIAFAVASSVDSRVILDQPGAERLLGRGLKVFHQASTLNRHRYGTRWPKKMMISTHSLTKRLRSFAGCGALRSRCCSAIYGSDTHAPHGSWINSKSEASSAPRRAGRNREKSLTMAISHHQVSRSDKSQPSLPHPNDSP